ncbi:hypothetical protein SEUCBS140593_000412 [Sporothrix eucalyptigena]|uniref:Uncharacterized protein n=1 Tax=Sporothrix eucalyptigena TaxID=1812306 RepID=A0ABP0APQ3_9PEZI
MADEDNGLSFSVDLVAQGDDNAFRVQNLPGEDFRRVLAQTTSEKSPLNMRINIVEIHHGTMVYEEEECPATLMIFEFRFQSRIHGHRYESVNVTLEFFDKGNNGRRDPLVTHLAPDRMHWLNKTTYDQRTKLATSAGLSGGSSGVASADVKVAWEMEQTRPLKFKATLTGSPTRSKGKLGDSENAVTWTMQENRDSADGVPSFLQTAVLLKRVTNAPFIANLCVNSSVDIKSASQRALSVTSDKDKKIDTVTITPEKVQIRSNKVSGLTAKDLESMDLIDLSKLFKVNLSEQDVLTPGYESVAVATKTEVTTGEATGGEATKDAGGSAGEGATRTKTTKFSLSLGNGEGADDDDGDDDGGDDGDDDAAGDNGSNDASTVAAALPVPQLSFSAEETRTSTTTTAVEPTAAPAPAPALERKLPLPEAPAALATPTAAAAPTTLEAPAAPLSLSALPSASALAPTLVSETVASAVEATKLAAQAAVTAAEAAKQAAEAATAASRAAEAVVLLLNKLGVQ